MIELNWPWAGAGEKICAHPTFSQYEGWTMSARYEALQNGVPCGADYGAETRFSIQEAHEKQVCVASDLDGSCEASNIASCWQCKGEYTGACPTQQPTVSQPQCSEGKDGDYCRYLYENTFALSYDAKTKTKDASHHKFVYGGPNIEGNYVQFWCASIPNLPQAASLQQCVDTGQDFELRVTTCIENEHLYRK